MNVPAFIIVCFISVLTYIGIRESKKTTNFLVVFKIVVILFVIAIGFFVDPGNWSPFMPNGFEGVLRGVSAVFYAYIGFDAISTTAEECQNPQRDLPPRGMIYSLLICTVLYVLIAFVLTGMVSFTELAVADPSRLSSKGSVSTGSAGYRFHQRCRCYDQCAARVPARDNPASG